MLNDVAKLRLLYTKSVRHFDQWDLRFLETLRPLVVPSLRLSTTTQNLPVSNYLRSLVSVSNLLFFLSKPMMSMLVSLKLAFQHLLFFLFYRVQLGAASPVNSLSSVSRCDLEHSFSAMAVTLHSLCGYTHYGWERKRHECVYTLWTTKSLGQ